MTWTDERVNTLMRLWNEGKSAKQISSEIGGVSRNAVIGKVHRLGIAVRTAERLPLPTNRTINEPTTKITQKIQNAPTPQAAEKPHSRPTPQKLMPIMTPESTHKILDLSESTCRWPIGDPTSADFHFCGRNTVAGKPYCLEHIKMAYTPSRSHNNKPANKPAVRVPETVD